LGIIGTITALIIYSVGPMKKSDAEWGLVYGAIFLLVVVIGISFVIPGFLFLIRAKLTWILAVIILCAELSGFIACVIFVFYRYTHPYQYSFVFGIVIYLVPLVLAIIDRKKYFEMLRQRELEKKP